MNISFKEVVWINMNDVDQQDMSAFRCWLSSNNIFPAIMAGSSGPTFMWAAFTKENAFKIKDYWSDKIKETF